MIRQLCSKAGRGVRIFMANCLVLILLFCLVEGLSSSVFRVKGMLLNKPIAERQHTQYDPELGWVNKPNLYIKDMYGPGIYFQTNARASRNTQDVSPRVPEGKVRVICSGDSFTLGYGVDNEHTWCHLLASMNNTLEAVNIGQGGYGIDQSYLLYKRFNAILDHDIHLFAFIADDFERMRYRTFSGYGKPLLTVQGEDLVTTNIPVPRRSFYIPWLTNNWETIEDFNVVRLGQIALRKFSRPTHQAPGSNDLERTHAVFLKIIDDLQRLNQHKGSILVLVFLPTIYDYTERLSDPWRQFLRAHVDPAACNLLDLVEEWHTLPPQAIERFFIAPQAQGYLGAESHYNAVGHAYIAATLYRRLLAIPAIAHRLHRDLDKAGASPPAS